MKNRIGELLDLNKVPQTLTQRSAMELAVRFALEQPGSTGFVLGVTNVSLDLLFRGNDGLHHVLSDWDILTKEFKANRAHILLRNGSQIIGYPAATHPERFDGLSINFVLVEDGAANGHTWEALTRRIRPLPGIENCIVFMSD